MIDSDNDYAEYEDDVPRRTGWVAVVYRWLLGIGVAVALVFGGVYLVYSFGIETAGPEQDGVPLIRAAKGPVKVRPADPGGLEVPNQGLGVYKTIDKAQRGKAAGDAPDARAPGPAAQQRSHPQGPVCHPVPTLMADTGLYRLAALNLAARKSAARKPAAPKSAASKPVGPKRSASAKRRVSVKPAVSTKPAVSAKPAERAGRPAANAAPAAAGTATVSTTATTGTAGADSRKISGKARRAAKVRSYRIQLGAFRTQAKARNHGRSLQRKHRSLLGRLSMVVERVDLGAKGVFYRLRTGPFANRQTARDLCRTLGKRRINCFLVSG
ncbi:MAG: hypothetical protein F4114_03890 [Rhodospirillaceae bacterium]|nr:hypothetical protein [Rhodospirillaceae bacterium]MYB11857.1 hypothetical protein [Rhodospirillaceae bacterium]MYI48215.1 hypothetical protein [Rhodospirillaceae bacterium]